MKLIYIEADKDEIQANKTLADALTEAISGFANSIVKFAPVLKAEYKFNDQEDDHEQS